MQRLGARHRGCQRLDLVDKSTALFPGQRQQLIAPAAGQHRVTVGDHHRRQAGHLNVGIRETDKQAGAERALGLHLAAAGLQFAVGRVVRALAHHMRQHRLAAPGHRRAAPVGQQRQHRAAGALAGFIHVDVRVGLVAGDHRAVLADGVVQVGVHVQRHADRHRGIDGADAAQQLALAVVVGLRDHRAVQVEQHRVAALRHRGADALGDVVERGVVHRPAGRGGGGDRHGVLGARRFSQVDEGGDGRARVAVGCHRGGAFGRHVGAGGKTRQRRGHRREGVGLVLHLRDDKFHGGLRGDRWAGVAGSGCRDHAKGIDRRHPRRDSGPAGAGPHSRQAGGVPAAKEPHVRLGFSAGA